MENIYECVEINSCRSSIQIQVDESFWVECPFNGDHESSTVWWRRHTYTKMKRTSTDHRKKSTSNRCVDSTLLDQSEFRMVSMMSSNIQNICESVWRIRIFGGILQISILKKCKMEAMISIEVTYILAIHLPSCRFCNVSFLNLVSSLISFCCCWNNQFILHIWRENCGNELIVPHWSNLVKTVHTHIFLNTNESHWMFWANASHSM